MSEKGRWLGLSVTLPGAATPGWQLLNTRSECSGAPLWQLRLHLILAVSLRSFILDPAGVTGPSLIKLSWPSWFWRFFLSLCRSHSAAWLLAIRAMFLSSCLPALSAASSCWLQRVFDVMLDLI